MLPFLWFDLSLNFSFESVQIRVENYFCRTNNVNDD